VRVPPLLSGPSYGLDEKDDFLSGIADERGYYYQSTGLLLAGQNAGRPQHEWAFDGESSREALVEGNERKVRVKKNVGFFGFYAGPRVYVLDPLALGDPLLARMPACHDPNWRIGHFERVVPNGYLETLSSGENSLVDRNLAMYYDRLDLVIRGPLFDRSRLHAIWGLNVGKYENLIDYESYRYPVLVRDGALGEDIVCR
jgi:arabinofuranosyltransferase